MDTSTVKASTNIYRTTLTYAMIFTKAYSSTSDEQVDNFTRELNMHYKAYIGSLIYLLYIRMDLSFSVHKLGKFSENPGKINFKGLIHLLTYIRKNRTLGLKFYAHMNYATLSDLLIQASIETDNKLMALYASIWKDCSHTGRSTGEYIIFFQGGIIDHGTNIPLPVAQSSEESEYNTECTTGIALAHFRMLIHELLDKDP